MKRHWFTLLMAVMTTAVCGGVGGYFAYNLVRQAGTPSWPSVKGTVNSSEVKTGRGSKGRTTYRPVVKYGYMVDGKAYGGSSVSLVSGFGDSGGSYARKTVAEFPAGAQVPVYYNPQAPHEAVLRRGLGDREWQVVALTGLILSVPAATWIILFGAVASSGGRVGTVRVRAPAPDVWVIRSLHLSALVAGVIGWGVGQVGTVVVTLAFLDDHVLEGVLIGWGATAVLAVGGYLLRSRWIAAGRRDHVIDVNNGVFILARGVSSTAESLPLESITGTELLQDSNISTNKRPHWRVHLVVAERDKTLPLVDISLKKDAEEFEGWLRERLGLGRGT